jgi:hypothetical protein
VSRDGSAPSLTRRDPGELTAASRFMVIVAERKSISAAAPCRCSVSASPAYENLTTLAASFTVGARCCDRTTAAP